MPLKYKSLFENAGEKGDPGQVQTVTGLNTDNGDPTNPIVKISVDGTSITGDGTPGSPLIGSGSVFQSDTYANWKTKRNNSTLPTGKWVKISDKGDTGIIIFCTTVNKFAEDSAVVGLLNADFQDRGDYSGVVTITAIAAGARQGVWRAALETGYAQGDMTIWNNIHYQLKSIGNIDGRDPSTNTTAYTELARTEINVGYIEQWDNCIYSFWNGTFNFIFDKRGNKVAQNAIARFPFGDNGITNVVMETNPTSDNNIILLNNRGTITGRVFGTNPYCYIPSNDSDILIDMSGVNQTINCPRNSGTLNVHLTGFSSGVYGADNSGTVNIYVNDESTPTFNGNTGTINATYSNESVWNHSNNAGVVDYGEFKNGSSGTLVLDSGKAHTNCIYSNISGVTFDPTLGASNQEFTNYPDYDNAVLAAASLQPNSLWRTSGNDITFLGGVANIVLRVP